jgi:hypothetical protein
MIPFVAQQKKSIWRINPGLQVFNHPRLNLLQISLNKQEIIPPTFTYWTQSILHPKKYNTRLKWNQN